MRERGVFTLEQAIHKLTQAPAELFGIHGRGRLAEGMAAEKLDALHSPAGLDIGAVTPDEIALSILAEIVQVRSKVGAGSMKSDITGASAG